MMMMATITGMSNLYGTYDDDRKSAEPGQFNEPFDIAIRGNKLLYVSEKGGRRIQILRLPDDLSASDPEVLQIIPSPGGVELAGLCRTVIVLCA